MIHSCAAIPLYLTNTNGMREEPVMADTHTRLGSRDARRTPEGPRRRARSGEGMITTTLALDRAVHRALTLAALDEHAVTAECMREAIEEWLARRTTSRGAMRAR